MADEKGTARDVTFQLLAKPHDDTAGNFKQFQAAYQSMYDAIDQMALASIEKRHKAELDKMEALKKGSIATFDGLAQVMAKAAQEQLEQMKAGHDRMMAQMRADFTALSRASTVASPVVYGATGTTGAAPVAMGTGAGTMAAGAKEVDQSLKAADSTLRNLNSGGEQFRVTIRGWLEDISRMKDELKAADELRRRISQFQNDPVALQTFQEEMVSYQDRTLRKRYQDQQAAEERARRQAMETKRARADIAGIREGDAGYDQFMGLGDKQQEAVIKARARLRDRVLKEERQQQEEMARLQQYQSDQEMTYLQKREARWNATEESILRTRESGAMRQNRINDKMTNELLGLANGTASFLRGFALLGIAGEENSQKMLDALIRTQAGFDVLMGGIRLVVNANQAWETYQRAMKLAAQEQQNETRAAQLAFEKSQALAGSLNQEADAATKAAMAHRGLADARNMGTHAGSYGVGTGSDGSMAARSAVVAATTGRRELGGYTLAPVGTRVGMREALGLDNDDGYRLAPPSPRGPRTIAGMSQVPADFDHSYTSMTRDQYSAEYQAFMHSIGRPTSARRIRQMMSRGASIGRSLADQGMAQGAGLDIGSMTGSAISELTGSALFGGMAGNMVVGAGTGLAAKAIGLAGAAAAPAFIAGGIAGGVGSGIDFYRAQNRYGFGGGADPGTYTAWMGDTYASSGAWMNRKLQGLGGLQGVATFGMGGPQDGFLGELNRVSAGELAIQRMQANAESMAGMRSQRESLAMSTIQANRPLEALRTRNIDFENEAATTQAMTWETNFRRSGDRASQMQLQGLTDQLRSLNERGLGGGAQARGIDALIAEMARERRETSIARLTESSMRDQIGLRNAMESASQERYRAQQEARTIRADLAANNGRGSQAALQDAREREIAAQERIVALTEQQRHLQVKIADEKRQATEAAIEGIQREIEARKAIIAQEKARVEAARERFGDMSEEQRRSVLESKQRIDAERSLVERTGLNSRQLREGQQNLQDLAGASQERMSLQQRIAEIEGNRATRENAPAQIQAAKRKLEELRAAGTDQVGIRAAEDELKALREGLDAAYRSKDRRVGDDELARLKGQFEQARTKESSLSEKARSFQETSMAAQFQAGQDRRSIATLESKIRGGGELTADERRDYDAARERVNAGVATGAEEADLRRVGALGLREGEELMRKRRQANADMGGFRSVSRDAASEMAERESQNISRKLEVELKDKRQMVVKVETNIDDLTRDIVNQVKPEMDRLRTALEQSVATSLANSERNSATAARGRAIGAGRG